MRIKVVLWEYERGWGSRPFHKEYFDNLADAEKYAEENESNMGLEKVPDYYIKAEISLEM
ncbi:MAG: hypothetical protein VKN72_07610 [Nostocales cyanobacterium 94392]|nr:hypothetical protein [Nostocales cyanobacterium 94392]